MPGDFRGEFIFRLYRMGIYTVLVTLLISDTNSTAYPTLIYGLYLPYGPGVGLRGLGWRFFNINRKGIKGMKGNRNVGTKDAFCGAKRV